MEENYLKHNERSHILTAEERQYFRAMARAPNPFQHSRRISNRLETFESPISGLGVRCTMEIPANTFIGVFWGQLYRRLPLNRRYSFEATVPGQKKLYLGAEKAGVHLHRHQLD